MIVVDTSIMSLVFRRKTGDRASTHIERMNHFIEEDAPLGIPGIVLQELLSGVKLPGQFEELAESVSGFTIMLAEERDHIRAAQINNVCRAQGVTSSATDCLIAAQTVRTNGKLYTLDDDFSRIAQHCSLELHAG